MQHRTWDIEEDCDDMHDLQGPHHAPVLFGIYVPKAYANYVRYGFSVKRARWLRWDDTCTAAKGLDA